jgi:hypothetical protein
MIDFSLRYKRSAKLPGRVPGSGPRNIQLKRFVSHCHDSYSRTNRACSRRLTLEHSPGLRGALTVVAKKAPSAHAIIAHGSATIRRIQMNKIQGRTPYFATALCFGIFAFATLGYASSNELLYVQDGHNLITYGVNPTTSVATKLGSTHLAADPNASFYTGYGLQVSHAPSAPFLYVLGFTSPVQEYFWVYATTSRGIAVGNPVQTLAVKPALTQFFILPNGKFAYAMYSWTANDSCENGNKAWFADAVLYSIAPRTGLLTNTRRPVVNFPANCFVISSLVRLNHAGSKLYTNGYNGLFESNDNTFSYYDVDEHTGLLSTGVQFWNLDTGMSGGAVYAISDKLFASWNGGEDQLAPGVYVYANGASLTTPSFVCDAAMASVCGDNWFVFDAVQFDPLGKYLFLNDQSISSVVIGSVDVTTHRLQETGSSIPGNPGVIAFSSDDKLVYTDSGNVGDANNKEISIYSFNPSSGLITAHSSFSLPSDVGTILPFVLP